MNFLTQKIENFSTLLIGDYYKNFQKDSSAHHSNFTQEEIHNSLEDLIQLYKKTGFLYPEKIQRIQPHMELIKDNWQAALKLDDQLLNIVQFKGNHPRKVKLTSISFWRTTYNSWVAQHLVSTGFPVGVCSMMLRAQAEVKIEQHRYLSFQNWFSHNNHFANQVFGTLVKTIGNEYASVRLYYYMGIEQINKLKTDKIRIDLFQHDMADELYDLYCRIRGTIDATAEEINDTDIGLDNLDQIYRKSGLRRKRYIWIASFKYKTKAIGAAIVHRGPFGLNFSLIENRCDLLIDQTLKKDQKQIVIHNLLSEAYRAYYEFDLDLPFPIKYVPVITDASSAKIIEFAKGKLLRKYRKSIWLRDAFEGWYKHIQHQYQSFLLKKYGKQITT